MKILIVVATQAEIDPFLSYFNLPRSNFIESKNFDVLVTGVGMVATAFALGQRLHSNYQLVLNVGIAGSFDQKRVLGALVNITEDTFAELGAEDREDFISLNELGFGENTYRSTAEIALLLPKAKGITVNKAHGSTTSIDLTTELFAPQTESMEGASVFYACEKLGIPCAQVRSISNYVEPRNREKWKIGLAIKNLNDWLIDFIKNS